MSNKTSYKKGQKVTYIKTLDCGFEETITAKVVSIFNHRVLLDSGDSFIDYNN